MKRSIFVLLVLFSLCIHSLAAAQCGHAYKLSNAADHLANAANVFYLSARDGKYLEERKGDYYDRNYYRLYRGYPLMTIQRLIFTSRYLAKEAAQLPCEVLERYIARVNRHYNYLLLDLTHLRYPIDHEQLVGWKEFSEAYAAFYDLAAPQGKA